MKLTPWGHTHSHSLYACYGTSTSARSRLPSLSTRTRAPCSSTHAAHCRATPSSLHCSLQPTLQRALHSTTAQPFISHHGSSSCLFQHHSSTTSRTQRFEVLVPHAGGRGSGPGFETYDLSGRGRQQGKAGGQPSPQGRGRSGGRGGGRGRARSCAASDSRSRAQPFAACNARHHSCISVASSPAPSLVPLCVSSSSSGARGEALVPHARGRGSDGFETYDLSGRGRQQGNAGFETYDLSGRGRQQGKADGQPSPQGGARGRSGGRGGGKGRGSLPSPSSPEDQVPSLGACLDDIEQLQNTPRLQANPAAYHLFKVGKRVNMETRVGAQLSSERSAILAAADTVAHLLLKPQSATSVPLVMQLDSKALSQLAWAMSALVSSDARAMSQPVRQLCYALAERASQPGVMDADVALRLKVACRNVAGALFGLGKAGIKCSDEYKGNFAPLISAVASRVGVKSGDVMAGATPQSWSNQIWACGKLVDHAGGQGSALGKGVAFIVREGAAAMEHAVSGPEARIQPKAQELANTLWGLAHFHWCDAGVIRVLAGAFVERISSSKPQEVANVVWALSTLGWYDWALYDDLLRNVKSSSKPQELSNVMYSCAMASHSGAAVDALAHMVRKQDLSGWKEQELSNTLYAWAVLRLLGMASHELHGMARALLSEANDRGPAAFKEKEFRQLYISHMEAERVGLQGGGLSTDNGMQQAAADENEQYQAELAWAKQSGASEVQKQAMAALQRAGYTVELGARVGGDGFAVDLLVQHESCPGGLAIYVVKADDFFKHPQGQLSGKVAAVHAQIRQRCDGLVVLSEAEAKQPAVVVGAVQRELARVAGRSGFVPGISTSSNVGAATSAPSKREQSRRAAVSPQLKGKPQRKQ